MTRDCYSFINNMKEKNTKKYLEPGYDPHQLRVVDLKQLLDHYDIAYPSKARKAVLIEIFSDELIPKLRKENGRFDETKRNASPRKKAAGSSPDFVKVKTGKKVSKVEKPILKSPSKESRKTLHHLLEQQHNSSIMSVSEDRTSINPFIESTVPKKRPFKRMDETRNKNGKTLTHSDSFYKSTRRKEQFSSSPISSPSKSGAPTDALFPRNVAIKFEDDNINEDSEREDTVKSTKRRKTSRRSPRKTSKNDVKPEKAQKDGKNVKSGIGEEQNIPNESSPTTSQLRDGEPDEKHNLSGLERYENETGSSVVRKDQSELSPESSQLSSLNYITAVNEPREVSDNESNLNINKIMAVSTSTPVSSPKKKAHMRIKSTKKNNNALTIKLMNEAQGKILKGPTKPIESPIKSEKGERKHEIVECTSSHDLSSSDGSIRAQIHTPEMQSSEEDETVLKQLQDEFDKETSRVEEESMIAMKSVDSSLKPFISRIAIYRFIFTWIFFLFSFLFFSIYRQQRIYIGFCGYEVYKPLLTVNKLEHPALAEYTDALNEAFKMNCVPCPEHAICGKFSHLECRQDYTISKPWYSGFGLIPTLNKCVLDSEKVAKINKIVKVSCDVLAKRNADFNCGTGDDDQVGLDFRSLQDYIIERLDMDKELEDGEFGYLWDKSLASMKEKQDLVFHDDFIRSNSHSKFSIKCKLKHFFLDMLIRLKYWIMGLSAVLIILSAVYLKLKMYIGEKKMVKELTEKVIEKLQQQSTLFRHHEVEHRYIGKIQLRDYYLTDPSIKQKKRTEIWGKVTKVIERNSNISAYQLEVNGEIMRVWEWASDI